MFNNNWTINGDEVRVNIPFAKVNKERRTVSGFATLDNVDTHGDVVDADASVAAFSRFRGNLREMHQPLAVGKVVDFVPQEFEDPETNETYKGIFVTAYISKGAKDTWEKVLDGTLSGFSVGGIIKNKEANKSAGVGNIIKEYDLIELSLVDNPANQLANVFSIQKLGDTTVASGFAVETKVQNILYNAEDDVVVLSDDESRDGFENIGWVEDTEGKTEKMRETLNKYLEGSLEHKSEKVRTAWYRKHGYDHREFVMSVYDDFVITRDEDDKTFRYTYNVTDDGYEFGERVEVEVRVEISEKAASVDDDSEQGSETSSLNKSEGGANVATEEKNEETVEEVEKSAEVEETKEENDETTEKAADVSEVAAGEVDTDAIVKAVTASVNSAVTEAVEKSAESVTEVKKSVDDALDALKKDIEGKIDALDERVSGVETGTAVKKSADVVENEDDNENEDKEEGFWRGGFLGTNDLVK